MSVPIVWPPDSDGRYLSGHLILRLSGLLLVTGTGFCAMSWTATGVTSPAKSTPTLEAPIPNPGCGQSVAMISAQYHVISRMVDLTEPLKGDVGGI
jgi:hypothetical protein